jgi:hypothetical protein
MQAGKSPILVERTAPNACGSRQSTNLSKEHTQPQLITSRHKDQTLRWTNTSGFAEWPTKPERMRRPLDWNWRNTSAFTNGAEAKQAAVLTRLPRWHRGGASLVDGFMRFDVGEDNFRSSDLVWNSASRGVFGPELQAVLFIALTIFQNLFHTSGPSIISV